MSGSSATRPSTSATGPAPSPSTASRPTEVSIPAGTVRVTDRHVPGHRGVAVHLPPPRPRGLRHGGDRPHRGVSQERRSSPARADACAFARLMHISPPPATPTFDDALQPHQLRTAVRGMPPRGSPDLVRVRALITASGAPDAADVHRGRAGVAAVVEQPAGRLDAAEVHHGGTWSGRKGRATGMHADDAGDVHRRRRVRPRPAPDRRGRG